MAKKVNLSWIEYNIRHMSDYPKYEFCENQIGNVTHMI